MVSLPRGLLSATMGISKGLKCVFLAGVSITSGAMAHSTDRG